MRNLIRFVLFLIVLAAALSPALSAAEPVSVKSSTQLLWGDDLLGEHQAVIAQYLRVSYTPDGKNYSLTGYGRVWDDLASGKVRSSDSEGRLYYFYLDYKPVDNVSARIGRQYTYFTSGNPLMDGATVQVHNIGRYLGVTAAAGWEVRYSLDSEFERAKDYFAGIDLHLENVRSTQLGVSYARRYRDGDLSREELGMNFRYLASKLSPYADVKYDLVSRVFDEATLGLDIYPIQNLYVKGEYYHAYPTFDAGSIYSVFAVDRYQEFMLRAEYSLGAPVTVFGGYTRQEYEEGEDANVYTIGARVYPLSGLAVTGAFNYRDGYTGYHGFTGQTDGHLYGFELYADYKVMKEVFAFAGLQYDTYKRPELETGENYATRFWGGARWLVNKNMAVTGRLEENINENFRHRFLGRVTLDWNL